MHKTHQNGTCTECFGLGAREILIVLERPELDGNGKLIRYLRKTIPCAACTEKKISRLEGPESPILRETQKTR